MELRDDQAALVGMSVIPGHLLLRVCQIEPALHWDGFDRDWLEQYLHEHPRALRHQAGMSTNSIVLTAETRDLQRFVLRHLNAGKSFKMESSDHPMLRLTPAPPSPPAPSE